jgi:hypothetical protein
LVVEDKASQLRDKRPVDGLWSADTISITALKLFNRKHASAINIHFFSIRFLSSASSCTTSVATNLLI